MIEEVGVVGLGNFGGGLGLTRELLKRGKRVRLFEKKPLEAFQESLKTLETWQESLSIVSGEHQLKDFEGLETVYLNPSVPWHGPLAADLRNQGISLSSDLELFLNEWTKPVIGITGTNGKSTCFEILSRLLPEWAAGGNRGISVFEMEAHEKRGAILELSSFQLERLNHRFPIAIVTNLTPDHLDHHAGFEEYRKAKEKITEFQKSGDLAILGSGLQDWPTHASKLILSDQVSEGSFAVKDNRVLFTDEFAVSLESFPLLGQHNQELAALSLAALRRALADDNQVQECWQKFCNEGMDPLPHRQQIVMREPYLIVDDSKSTTPESTICAMRTFYSEGSMMHLICGGVDKGFSIQNLIQELSGKRIQVYVVGEQRRLWEKEVATLKNITVNGCENLSEALGKISGQIKEKEIVLLSPGTSSYDQFRDYRERGTVFQELVREIICK